MSEDTLFSATLRFVVLAETELSNGGYDSVFLFRSVDFETAFARALALGRERQQLYKNGVGNLVEWKFSEIRTLDCLATENLDGVEVVSNRFEFPFDVRLAFDTPFSPEQSKPTQTV